MKLMYLSVKGVLFGNDYIFLLHVELFGSEIAPFLEQGEVVFGGVRELLAEQFARLSAVEQSVLLWLAILISGVQGSTDAQRATLRAWGAIEDGTVARL